MRISRDALKMEHAQFINVCRFSLPRTNKIRSCRLHLKLQRSIIVLFSDSV